MTSDSTPVAARCVTMLLTALFFTREYRNVIRVYPLYHIVPFFLLRTSKLGVCDSLAGSWSKAQMAETVGGTCSIVPFSLLWSQG